MVQIFKIAKAWHSVFKGMKTEEHSRRAEICKDCPSKRYSKFFDFIEDDLKEVKGFVCDECGCALVAKIRSNNKCPLNKW
tara:strand:- start:1133 stop:1372 length:240 start_codon:yes stop_codon:yes gene_type:complete